MTGVRVTAARVSERKTQTLSMGVLVRTIPALVTTNAVVIFVSARARQPVCLVYTVHARKNAYDDNAYCISKS